MSELMTLFEVASYLKVTPKTVYRMLERGKIPATKVGRQWRFNKGTIDEWLQRYTTDVRANVLVVDDEKIILRLFKVTLEEFGHHVTGVDNAYDGLERLRGQDFDIIFLDLKMPGMDGADMLHEIKIIKPKLPVILITGYPESEVMSRALKIGSFGVMNKPFKKNEIIDCIERLFSMKHVR